MNFSNQKPRRRKVELHFTIPRGGEVLCFYNENQRHRKVEAVSKKEINIFLFSLLKSFPLYDHGGSDGKIQYFGMRRNRKVERALYASGGRFINHEIWRLSESSSTQITLVF